MARVPSLLAVLVLSLFAVLSPAAATLVPDASFHPPRGLATFNGPGFGDENIAAAAVQADGKMVLVGFLETDLARHVLLAMRVTAAGELDSTFAGKGWVTYAPPLTTSRFYGPGVYGSGGGTADAASVLIQPDGKILIAGNQTGSRIGGIVLRLLSDGSFDPGFGGGDGIAVFDAENVHISLDEVALQPDGKILAFGMSEAPSQTVPGTVDASNFLLRYAADGTLDPTFGAGTGIVYDAREVLTEGIPLLQPDGTILVAGSRPADGVIQDGRIFLRRFGADGAIDAAFNRELHRGFGAGVNDAVVAADGKIVLACHENLDILVIRCTAAGDLDATFGSGGIVLHGGEDPEETGGVALLDGKILVSGSVGWDAATKPLLIRLNADGSPDATFGSNGVAATPALGAYASAVFVMNDGTLRTVGSTLMRRPSDNGSVDAVILAYDANGALDSSFGSGGAAVPNPASGDPEDFVGDLLVQPNGKVLALAESSKFFTYTFTDSDLVLVRFNPDGSLDSAFGAGRGYVAYDHGSLTSDEGGRLALQGDGKILVVGTSIRRIQAPDDTSPEACFSLTVVRYLADGTLDAGFGTGGVVYYTAAPDHISAAAVAVQPDGKIVVAGSSTRYLAGGALESEMLVLRFDASGALDTGFGDAGSVRLAGIGTDLALVAGGKILLLGRIDQDGLRGIQVVRLSPGGALDPSFGTGGKTLYFGNADVFGNRMRIREDGAILIAGSISEPSSGRSGGLMLRMTPAGALDASFGGGSGCVVSFKDEATLGYEDVVFQGDGIVALRSEMPYGIDVATYVCNEGPLSRFLADGTPDTAFGASECFPNGGYGTVLAKQADGKILVGGSIVPDLAKPSHDAAIWRFSVSDAPATVTLLSPDGLVATSTPTYTWDAQPGVDSYQLWVGTGATTAYSAWISAAAAGCGTGAGVCSATPTAPIAAGTWFFNVRGRNSYGTGPWAASKRFAYSLAVQPAGLSLIAPWGVIGSPTPTFSWAAQSGVDSYQLWVGTGTTTAVSQWYTAAAAGCGTGIGTCSVTPAVTLAAGGWYFNVRGQNTAGIGRWAPAARFVFSPVPAPSAVTLLAPSGAAGTPTPAYEWAAQPGVDSYLLWVGTGASTAVSIWYTAAAAGCDGGTGTCTVTPTTALATGQWYFNVKGKNAAGAGPWAVAKGFSAP